MFSKNHWNNVSDIDNPNDEIKTKTTRYLNVYYSKTPYTKGMKLINRGYRFKSTSVEVGSTFNKKARSLSQGFCHNVVLAHTEMIDVYTAGEIEYSIPYDKQEE